jgi:ketosteroid isomerase-like protein
MGEPVGNLQIARKYLQALERGDTGADLSRFFAPDVVLEEFPNRLTPSVKRRDLVAALEGAERGKKAMSRQIYKIKQEIPALDRVALEVEWVGTLPYPLDPYRPEGR